jgi:propionyl-CoA synthetase
VLKKQDPACMHKYDLSSLKHIFMAGEPLDEPTARVVQNELQKPVIDNYWQTETGWPMLAALPGVEKTPIKYGSPSFPVYGYNLQDLPRRWFRLRRQRKGYRCGDPAAAAGLPVHRLGSG